MTQEQARPNPILGGVFSMQSQSRAHTQDQSRARLRIGGRLVLLVALLSSALVSGAAMAKAQAPVQTEYRYGAVGNLKSVSIQPAKHSPGDAGAQPLLWALDNPSESQLSAIEVPAGDGQEGQALNLKWSRGSGLKSKGKT